MKYLCLVYYDEKTLDAMPKEEFEPFSEAHVVLDEELRRNGQSIVAEALQPVSVAVPTLNTPPPSLPTVLPLIVQLLAVNVP